MPAAMREHLYGSNQDGLEVWPENWRAVTLFCFAATQWRRSDTGARLGLDYAAVGIIFEMHRIPPRQHASLIADIRLIEFGALKALQEKAEN